MGGNQDYVWRKTETLEELELVSQACLREGRHAITAEFFLHHHEFIPPSSWHFPEWRFTENTYPHIFTVVERHLEESNDKQDIAIWADILRGASFEHENDHRLIKYYEKAGRYNECLQEMTGGKYSRRNTYEDELRTLEKEIPELEKKGDLEGLALRYAVLDK